MKTIAFLPARCGSKSIPGKNIRSFYGKPLIYWALKAANDASCIDEIILATDCAEIVTTGLGFGFKKLVIYHRSPENARDTSSTESVILEYLTKINSDPSDFFILLQATSPFTQGVQLDEAFIQMKNEGSDSLLSCAPFKRFLWNREGKALNYNYMKRPRRQDISHDFIENGAFYISRVKNILESGNRLSGKISVYEMPEYTQLEMDEESDWYMGESVMARIGSIQKKDYSQVKLFLSDIDGVLTDGGMYYSEKGDELKKFHTYDGMGFHMLKSRGIKTGLITGESRELNIRRFNKLKLDYFFPGADHKLKIVREICSELNIGLQNVAFVGDDINDKEVLENIGFPACPASAQDIVKNIPGIYHLKRGGGEGAVREFINLVLQHAR